MTEGNKFKSWVFALKIPSWPKIFTAFCLGQGIGIYTSGLNMLALLIGIVFCGAGVSFIVLLNDYRDQKVDGIKRDLFPDSSLKTIPDGVLSSTSILIGVFVSAGLAFAAAIFGNIFLQLNGLFVFSIICCLTFVIYSVPPIELNYNGGGEVIEMLGVGVLLPAFSTFLQVGDWSQMIPLIYFLPLSILLSLSSALASGLSDEVSDIKGNKTTFTTMFGNKSVRKAIMIVLCLAVPAAFIPIIIEPNLWWGVLLFVAFTCFQIVKLVKISPLAVTNAFDSIRNYKKVLHKIIWWGLSWLTLVLIIIKYSC